MVTLEPKRAFDVPINADCINPDIFNGKTIEQIGELAVYEGNRLLTLKDLFNIKDDKSATITLNGDFCKVKLVGLGMKTGEIIINGNAGMHTGEKMPGGKIVINGNAEGWTGGAMRGGIIEIHGNAGDYIAAPSRGSTEGMKGGVISVDGNVGCEVADFMRGGVIKIKGNAGPYLGFSMQDGVIYVAGNVEARAGALMTGGKIAISGHFEATMPSFSVDSVKPNIKVDDTMKVAGPFYVFIGDLNEKGKGKMFISKPSNPQMAFFDKYL